MPHSDPDSNLILGLLALRNHLVDRTALVNAYQARDGQSRLARSLAEFGAIDAETVELLELLTRKYLQCHGGDCLHALGDLVAQPELRSALAELTGAGPGVLSEAQALAPDAGPTGPVLSASMSVDDPADVVASARPGRPVDRYRILRPHARGNLGQVFVALDTELGREVALKEILEHRVGDGRYRDRFLVEAEITGRLQHPGIVPVYGLGTYADGRPYYAMRFIRGGSLKDAIEQFHSGLSPDPGPAGTATDAGADPEAEGGLDRGSADPSAQPTPGVAGGRNRDEPESRSVGLRRLLRRFQDVCNAVDYAHSRGVLHRDLKPANIVVGRHGETLVVDWGLAKATGRSDDPAGADEPPVDVSPGSGSGSETQPGRPLGTPAYASPEQLAGELDRLGPATDVYGLGAILSHLLTGQVPFQGRDLAAVIRAVQAGEFPAPRALDPSIPKPLEAVCLKAMALRPEDRYATARELGEDVERWLADEPVRARPEPLPERLRRWGRRHRTAVAAAAVGLVMAVLGLGAVSAVQTRSRNQLAQQNVLLDLQRQRAESRERQAIEAVGRFRDAIVQEPRLLDTPELEMLRRRLLTEPLAFFRSLRDQLQADRETLPESLVRLAVTAVAVGQLSDEIGDKLQARLTYEEARGIYARLAGAHPGDAVYPRELAMCHNNIGNLQREAGQTSEGSRSHLLALAIQQRLAAVNPSDPGIQRDLAGTYNNLGVLQSQSGQPGQALRSYEQALAIQQRLEAANPAIAGLQGDLARSHSNIGVLQRATGSPDEALRSFEAALAIQQRLADANPSATEVRRDLASFSNNLGGLQGETGQPGQALRSFEAVLVLRKELARTHPSVSEYQSELAGGYNNIATMQRAMGHPEASLRAHEAAMDIQQRLTVANPTSSRFQRDLALSFFRIGSLQRETGHADEASRILMQARAIQQSLADANPSITEFQGDLARTLNELGILQSQTGHRVEALQSYESALAIQQRLAAENPSVSGPLNELVGTYNNLGGLQGETGHPEQALKSFETALELQRRLAEANPSVAEFQKVLAATYNNVGVMQRAGGQLEEALQSSTAALKIRSQLAAANPSIVEYQNDLARSQSTIGRLQKATGHPDEALRWFTAALEIRRRLVEANPSAIGSQFDLGDTYNEMGTLQSQIGHPDEAFRSYEAAREIMAHLLVVEPSKFDRAVGLGGILHNLASIDLVAGRPDAARGRLLEAVRLQRTALRETPGHPTARAFLRGHLKLLIDVTEAQGLTQEAAEARRELDRLTLTPDSPASQP